MAQFIGLMLVSVILAEVSTPPKASAIGHCQWLIELDEKLLEINF